MLAVARSHSADRYLLGEDAALANCHREEQHRMLLLLFMKECSRLPALKDELQRAEMV